MGSIVGKWITSGHLVYEFDDNGFFETYTTADRSRGIMGRYSVSGRTLSLTVPGKNNSLGFSVYGDTLSLYPDDGGSPIVFDRTN